MALFRRNEIHPTAAASAGFLYEMHQHSARCSACGRDDVRDVVRQLKKEGYAGMVLTNHFYHGNTALRRQQAWEDFVWPYEEDYLQAKAEGDRLDFDVLFGIEEVVGYGWKEVLVYGITPSFLYDHPELAEGGEETEHLARLTALVHEAGGVVFQAHPFRVRDYIPRPWEELPAELLDGVEGYNACNSPMENARAVAMAQQKGLLVIAGSDAHTAVQQERYGLLFDRRIKDEAALADSLRQEAYTLYLGE